MEFVFPEDWPLVLRNFHSALRPDGRLYFSVELAGAKEIQVAFEKGQQMGFPVVYGEWAHEGGYHTYPNIEQVKEWLELARFHISCEEAITAGRANDEFMSHNMSQGDTFDNEKRLQEVSQYWDNAAASFDNEPDHGLHDPQVRRAWTKLLSTWLPTNKAAVLDLGCGTGSLSVILAGLGHYVTGIDVSPTMIARAQAKANALGHQIEFHVMDAAMPQFAPRSFDVIVCRHLLWSLPEPSHVLQRWVDLLKPRGRLILIEGYWSTGAGLHATELMAALPSTVTTISVQNLSGRPEHWGKKVTDERYAIIADLHQ